MKFIKHIILILAFIFVYSNQAKAQIDTLFWYAASWITPDHADNKPMAFHFSTFANPTTIRLRQPASTYDTTFVVPANSLFSKYVTHILSQVESLPADDPTITTGFEITSDFPIVVVYDFLSSGNNPETYSLKGQNGMGKEFVIPFQTLWNNKVLGSDNNGDGVVTQPKQQFSVVAAEDNTTIYITPRCNTIGGHPANVTYAVFLPLAGNVYTCENAVQNTSVAGNSLAGTVVVSDKNISITTTDDSVNPSGGGGCYDVLGDQIVPVDVLGQEYNVNKGFLNAGSDESAFILATENFTTITIDDGTGVTTAILNQGDTYQYSITQQLTNIKADKNVYVLHMSGYGCELGSAILPPVNCAGSDQVSFPRTNGLSFLLNIICPAGAEGNFLVNGDPTIVQASDFAVIPGTGGAFMGAQINVTTAQIPSGSSNLITNSSDLFSLGIINGTATGGCLYHYLSTFLRRVIVDANIDQNLCTAETQVNLTGSVSGGVTTGFWTVLDGSGTLNSPTNLNTTYDIVQSDYTQGYLTFALQSTGNCEPKFDTMKVTFVQSPDVQINPVSSYCKNNVGAIPLGGSINFTVGSEWSGGSGAFANFGDLNTTYTPAPGDLAIDSAVIYLTSVGSIYGCPPDKDSTVIYFSDPPTVVSGADQVVCTNETQITLGGAVTGASTTGSWASSGSGAFSPDATTLNGDYLISAGDQGVGTVKLILTSTNNGNCLSVSDSLILTILPEPVANITTNDSLCANVTSLNLTGTITSGYTPLWTVNGSGAIASPNSINTIYSIVPADTVGGFMDVFLETNGGICPVTKDSLRIIFVAPPVVDAGVDLSYCANELVQLNGSIAGTANSATWTSTGTGSFSPSNTSLNTFYIPSANDVTNGSVQLILTSSADFGCNADADNFLVTFKTIPTADFSANTACQGSQTNFTDLSSPNGSIATWQYYFGDNGTSIAQNPIHVYTTSGTLPVILIVESTNGCVDTITKNIVVNPQPNVMFSSDLACKNSDVFFIDNTFISAGGISSWDWDFSNGETSTIQNPSTIYSTVGTYDVTLTVTSDSNCVNTLTQSIDVLAGPIADFTFNPESAFSLEDVTFTDQSSNGPINDWLWDFGDGSGETNQNPIHQYADGGTYNIILEVTDTSGCKADTTKSIIVGLPPVLPSAFTPNGDGDNDVYIIRGGPFDEIDFKIYNNWGQLIFTSTDISNGWDGTFNGEDAPMGVYTWTFTVIIGETIITKEGDVTLMR